MSIPLEVGGLGGLEPPSIPLEVGGGLGGLEPPSIPLEVGGLGGLEPPSIPLAPLQQKRQNMRGNLQSATGNIV